LYIFGTEKTEKEKKEKKRGLLKKGFFCLSHSSVESKRQEKEKRKIR
jgi:hypothetical protein